MSLSCLNKIILLSKSSLKDNYAAWLKCLCPEIQLADAYSAEKESLDKFLENCSGILLTGGADINPARYGKATDESRCEGIDDKRDQLEINLVTAAIVKKIPLLAICRGIQLVNIYFNGTLIIDIPSDYGKLVEHRNKEDVSHRIKIAKDSALYDYGRIDKVIVNSKHHQGIQSLGDGLVPVAYSEDGLIEAIEIESKISHPFFTGVQWHPERMEINNPMSGIMGKAFLSSAFQQ